MSVKVAIRVRPFNERQKFLGCVSCVQMKQNTTVVYESRGKQKKQHYFTFDYSFWSHDGFEQNQNGYLVPVDNNYIDQSRVYQLLGEQILQNAWVGFNCCLFAYGQTGAGKSYSMIGYGANKGIIPMACEQLFQRIKRFQKKGERQYEVTISMLQIYNQKVQDLLINTNKRPTNGLKIRQNKALGVYVQGLNKFPVYSYKQIQKKMDQGSKNRSLASTLMNEYSSRAHTIVMLEFIQKQWITSKKMSKKTSLINLVDLAGSERVSKTGVGDNKDRLKQASLINKSLHTLGRVIEALAEQCVGKGKTIAIPYRQSALTRILQNALGGNSKTTMICAISPANDNCQQTLSTLRYADKTKKIKNKPVVNESQVDKLIRRLRQQNQRLKKLLQTAAQDQKSSPLKGMLSSKTQSQRKQQKSNVRASMRQIQKQIRKNLQSFAINTDDVIDEADCQQSLMMTQFIDLQDPSLASEWQSSFTSNNGKAQVYITNLNEDQLLNFKIKYNCENNLLITNKNSKKNNEEILIQEPLKKVVLCGLGIQENHAKITNQKGKYFIQALTQTSSQYTLLNGKPVYKRQELKHNDRVILGTNSVFLFKNLTNPQERSNKKYTSQKSVGYQFAINQRQQQYEDENVFPYNGSPSRRRNPSNNTIGQDKQLLAKLQQIQNQFSKMIEENQRKTREKEEKYKQKLIQLQREKQEKQKEKEKLQNKLNEKKQETYKLRTKELQIQKLQKKLAQFEEEKQKRKKIRQSMLLDEGQSQDQLQLVGLTHFQDIGTGQNYSDMGIGNDKVNKNKKKPKNVNNQGSSPVESPKNDKNSPSKDDGFQQVYLQQYDQKSALGTTNTNSIQIQQSYFMNNFDNQPQEFINQNKMKKNSKKYPQFQDTFNEAEQIQKYNKIVNVYLDKIKHKMGVFTKLYDITIYSERLKLQPEKKEEMEEFNCQTNGGFHFCRHCKKVINNHKHEKQGSVYNIYMDERQKNITGIGSEYFKDNNSFSRSISSKKQSQTSSKKSKKSFNMNEQKNDPNRNKQQSEQNRTSYFKLKQIDQENKKVTLNLNKSNLSDFLKEQSQKRKNSYQDQRRSDSLPDQSFLLNGTNIQFEQNKNSRNRKRNDSQQLFENAKNAKKIQDEVQQANIEDSPHEKRKNRLSEGVVQELNRQPNGDKNKFSINKMAASQFQLGEDTEEYEQNPNVKRSTYNFDNNQENQQTLLLYLSQSNIEEEQNIPKSKKSGGKQLQKMISIKNDNLAIVPSQSLVITPTKIKLPVAKKPVVSQVQIQTDIIPQENIIDSLQIKPKESTKMKRQQLLGMEFDFSVSDIQQGDHQNSVQQSLNLSSLNSFKEQELSNQIQLLKQKIKMLQTQNSAGGSGVPKPKNTYSPFLEKTSSQGGESNEQDQGTESPGQRTERIRNKLRIGKKNSQKQKILQVVDQQQQINSPGKQTPKKSPSKIKKSSIQLPQQFSQKQFLKRRKRNGQQDNQLQKQLQSNIIFCNNQNIINQRNLNIRKRKRQVQQLKKSLFKKQKIELQKQLFNIIPMIERFNRIAKEMNRLIEAKIEIEYRNFSHYEIIQALKNFTKSKWKKGSNFTNVSIRIIVANLEEARIYKWPLEVFKNRFEIAEEIFQKYIENNEQNTLLSPYNKSQIDKTKDPFWDPLDFVPTGIGYLSIQCILYNVDYEGQISFVQNSIVIAKAYIHLNPVKVKKRNIPSSTLNQNGQNQQNQATTIIQSQQPQNQYQIYNPRNFIQKSLYFTLSIQNVIFMEPNRDNSSAPLKFQISYELLIDDYKQQVYTTQEIQFRSYSQNHELNYLRRHCFKQISESTLAYISDCPIKVTLNLMKDYNQECLNSSFNQDLQRSIDDTNSALDTSMTSSNLDILSQKDVSDTMSNLSYKTPQKSQINGESEIKGTDPKKPDFSKKQKKPIIYENTQMLDKMNRQAQEQQKRRKQKRQKLMQKQANLKSKKQKLNKKDDKDCTIY